MAELISVIIPVYKVGLYLDRCIESIVNQTYENLEIILVDDGSPDECPEMCDRWAEKDSRIQVIHKQNGGLSDARNVGMDAAAGEMMAFVDSDDYTEPEYIEYMYEALKETGADISMCGHHVFYDSAKEDSYIPEKTKIVSVQSREEALTIFTDPDLANNHTVWNKLYRSAIVKDVRFALGFQAQDVLFSCQVFCKCNSIAVVECELYHYRMHPGNASTAFLAQRIHAYEMYYRSYEHLKKNYPQFTKGIKARCCSLCIGAADWALNVAEKEQGKKLIEETYRFRPRIHFTLKEWLSCSLKNKVRIICSERFLLIPAMRIRYLVRLATGR